MIHQADPHKRGAAARNKGKNAENMLAKMIRDRWGYEVRRGHVFDHESDLVGLEGIHPEVKRQEKLNIHKAMEQAKEEAKIRNDGLPTVFSKKDGSEWLVTMRLEDWMDLYGVWVDPIPDIDDDEEE